MDLPRQTPLTFQDALLPADAHLAGLAALAHAFGVRAPVRRPACVSARHVGGGVRHEGGWSLFDRRYDPGDTVGAHLAFALRHEPLDLLVLKRAFAAIGDDAIAGLVRATPTGSVARRLWFLYEHLTGRVLDVPDAPSVAAVELLDPKRYHTVVGEVSRRHRVRDNMLGTPAFSPIVRRTAALDALAAARPGERAQSTLGRVGRHVVARAASFLLLADSQASFAIEGERPPRGRLERWGRAVSQAGRRPLTVEELVRLHAVLIEDDRFTRVGLRTDGVFVGERAPDGAPLPEFIGARPEDLPALVAGLLAANARMSAAGVDPIVQAAATAFGFVYVHPLQDGNGRLHRCLIHHVLAERRFAPPGLIFPVSSVMLDRIDAYRATLQAHTGPLMAYIPWRPTAAGNVEVRDDTSDCYRYYDATGAAEFLYQCVERTVAHDLPREIAYLERHDAAMRGVMAFVEMPDRVAADLIMFVRQADGRLPRRRREREFGALTDDEVAALEAIVREAFAGFDDMGAGA